LPIGPTTPEIDQPTLQWLLTSFGTSIGPSSLPSIASSQILPGSTRVSVK